MQKKIRKYLYIFILFFYFPKLFSNELPGTVQSKKLEPLPVTTFSSGNNTYSILEMQHVLQSYFERSGFISREEPSLELKAQLGMLLKDGLFDMYFTGAGYKIPRTQKMFMKRSEIEFDIIPLKNNFYKLTQYNAMGLPFHEVNPRTGEEVPEEKMGSIYTVGLINQVNYEYPIEGHTFSLKFNSDLWTLLYSRKQMTDIHAEPKERDHYFMLNFENEGNENNLGEEKKIEDYAQHIYHQMGLSLGYTPSFLRPFYGEVSSFYTEAWLPRYFENENQNISYEYEKDRSSYYRLRGQLNLTANMTIMNDFFHYYDGFYQTAKELPYKRFKNVVRLSYKM